MLAIVKVVSQRLAVQSRSGWVSHEHGSTDLHSGRARTGGAVHDFRKTWTDGASYDAMVSPSAAKGAESSVDYCANFHQETRGRNLLRATRLGTTT